MRPVLFDGDILDYPNATYHVETKNRSFVRFALMLKQMGIKNNMFCLTLLDPRLVDVDPFNPRNQDERDWVSLECSLNPWYVLREVARTDSGEKFTANRGVISFVWLFFNHISIIHTQPRQTGKTLVLCFILIELANFIYTDTTINVITLSEKLRDETTSKMKKMLSNLPEYLNQRTRRDTDVSEHIKIAAKENVVRFWLPRADEPNARNMCRGSSSPTLFGDEPPFQPNFDISWPAAQNSMGDKAKRAKAAGQPYGEAIFTTAGVTTTRSGKFTYDIIQKSAVFNEGLYDCENMEVLHETVRRAAGGVLRIYSEFNALQLGMPAEELAEKVRSNTGDISQIAMELFNVWQSGEATNPIDPDILARMVNSMRDPAYVERDDATNFQLFWYVPEDELEAYLQRESFVMTLDMAQGSGGDDCSLTIVNTSTAEVIGAGTINVVNTFAFTLYIAKFFIRIPNMVFLPEYKSLGISVVHFLLDYLPSIGEDPFSRIFNWVVNDKDTTHEKTATYLEAVRSKGDPKVLRKYQSEFGYTTSGSGKQSRGMLYNTTLREFAAIAADGMHNRKLVQQTCKLERVDGRTDHRKGEHDDAVIGWLLAGWFIQFANNKDLYSIDARKVLAGVRAKTLATLSTEELIGQRENNRLMELIKAKLETLKECKDSYRAVAIEDEIRFLGNKLDSSYHKTMPLSIDDMLSEARSQADKQSDNAYGYGYGSRSTNPFFRPFL